MDHGTHSGSTGFGKKWLHAGDDGWGSHMQHDVTDAALWAVEQGIADRVGPSQFPWIEYFIDSTLVSL